MIETGPQEAAHAAWEALNEAMGRAKNVAVTGQAELDRAVQLAHLKAVKRCAIRYTQAVDALEEQLGG